MTSTLYFKKKFGVNIKDVRTTEDIDQVIEKKSGQKIQTSKQTCGINDKAGNVFPFISLDINKRIDKILNRK